MKRRFGVDKLLIEVCGNGSKLSIATPAMFSYFCVSESRKEVS